MKKFVRLHVKKDEDEDIIKMTDRYIRPERITELRRLVNDEHKERFEVVLDTGEVTFLDWESDDKAIDFLSVLRS